MVLCICNQGTGVELVGSGCDCLVSEVYRLWFIIFSALQESGL